MQKLFPVTVVQNKMKGAFKCSLGKMNSATTLLICIRKVTGLNLTGTPAILNQYFRTFLEALQVSSGKESQIFKDAFLPSPLQFIIYTPPNHSTPHSLSYETRHQVTHE
jgi:hypothetical protein